MERRRLQQQKMKQQQRFCISQQDLTDAIARMKQTSNNLSNQQHVKHESLTNISFPSSIEALDNRSVSQIIKDFETRKNLTPYASAQDLLPIINDVISNGKKSNCNHMFIETMKIKDDSNDKDIINNNVCSSISFPINDDNQMVREKIIYQHKFTVDREQEKIVEEIQQTSNDNRHKQDLLLSTTYSYNNHHPIKMSTRCTDIDAAALSLAKQHERRFDELLIKEAQLNHALADLISISNDNQKSTSIPSSPKPLSKSQEHQQVSNDKDNNNNNSISASIDLLNDLLQKFDLDDKDSETKTQENSTKDTTDVKPINMFCLMLSDNVCANCQQSFATNEQIVNAAGRIWHTHCFVCTQCFQPFQNGIYFEHDDRKYCERDFQMLFAPCCNECKQAIVGRVIRAIQKCFHPDCFRCQSCQISLVEIGFCKHNDRAYCRDCYTKEKAQDLTLFQPICTLCQQIIDNKCLKYQGENYHSYHFQCTSCRTELDENGREARSLLYCLPCYNQLNLSICSACRCVIEDRVIHALGKQWHVEHFCCAHCAQPFHGNKHFENNGLAYCEFDYHTLFGSTCFICKNILTDGVYTACNKQYCSKHFTCSLCEKQMNEKSKFFDVDATPVCKQCYGKLSSTIRKSLEQKPKKCKQSSV